MAIQAGRYDLVIEQGADLSLFFGIKYRDTDGSLKLLDTAGYTARAQVRADYGSPVLLDMTTANGRLTVGIQGTAPDQWNLQMTVNNATTAALADFGVGLWDMEIVDSAGNVQRVIQGRAVLSREVTK